MTLKVDEATQSLVTRDGLRLVATVFAPAQEAKAGVLINSATAVSQRFYKRFATFLARQGYLTITYDYRGIGRSAIRNSRDRRLTMEAWGKLDLAAVIEWSQQNHGDLDWHCVGHSVGGQIVGLAANSPSFKSIYCISAQSGYWKHWQSFRRAKMFAMWHVVIPGLSVLLGKVPGALLGGQSLPGGIARQWAYWGRNQDYIVDGHGMPIRDGFARVECDMKFIAIDDDSDFAPLEAVEALKNFYSSANSDIEVVRASEYSKGRIGHFGFFQGGFEHSLWTDVVEWLNARLS